MLTEEELQFDLEGLRKLQEKRLANIKVFEEAIREEIAAINHEKQIIATLEGDLCGDTR